MTNIERLLWNNGRTLRFVVSECARGWRIREEEGSVVVHDVVHEDWHRVERHVSLFDWKAETLRQQGWVDSEPPTS